MVPASDLKLVIENLNYGLPYIGNNLLYKINLCLDKYNTYSAIIQDVTTQFKALENKVKPSEKCTHCEYSTNCEKRFLAGFLM